MLFNIVLQLIFSLIFRCRNFWSIFHSPFPVLHPSPFSVSNLYEMNKVTKVGLINFQTYQFQIKASFFHSTPVLERKRRTHWDYGGGASGGSSRKSNHFSKRYARLHSKQEMLNNVSAYAEHLFKSWQYDWYEHDSSTRQSTGSWFRQDHQGNGSRSAKLRNNGTNFWNRRGFQFSEDDDIDVEAIFSSAFGGRDRYFFYSFTREEPEWQNSYFRSNSYRYTRNQRNQYEDEYESSSESESSVSDMRSDRQALGLSVSGPLSLDDVKNAYRACALKWHPDRHQGSFKVVAEEKFKVCSAAYQSLCDKLALEV